MDSRLPFTTEHSSESLRHIYNEWTRKRSHFQIGSAKINLELIRYGGYRSKRFFFPFFRLRSLSIQCECALTATLKTFQMLIFFTRKDINKWVGTLICRVLYFLAKNTQQFCRVVNITWFSMSYTCLNLHSAVVPGGYNLTSTMHWPQTLRTLAAHLDKLTRYILLQLQGQVKVCYAQINAWSCELLLNIFCRLIIAIHK